MAVLTEIINYTRVAIIYLIILLFLLNYLKNMLSAENRVSFKILMSPHTRIFLHHSVPRSYGSSVIATTRKATKDHINRHVTVSITVQRDATQSSLFIILPVHSTCFGCQPHPSSGVHKTVTTASGTVQLPPSNVAKLRNMQSEHAE